MTKIKKYLSATQSELEIVNNFISKGEYKEALTALDHLSQKYPNDPTLFFLGGNCYGSLSHFDQAILCFQEAIKVKPDMAEAHHNLGVYLKEKEDIDKAILSYKRAIKLKPDFAEAHNNLGICLHELGKPDEALICHKRAISISPDMAEAHNNLANALKVLGQVEEAIVSLKRALEIKPNSRAALDNLNLTFIELGRSDEFKETYNKSLGKNEDYEQGFLMLEERNFTEAIKFFEKAQVLQWQEKVLECHYKNKQFEQFKQKLDSLIEQKKSSPFLATLSAHYAQNFRIKDPYNFCPSPLNFVSHEQVPELIENNKNLIKELVKDINTSEILKRQYQSLFNNSAVEQSAGDLFKRPEKSFHKLSDALINAIKKYYLLHQNEDNEFIRSFPKDIKFSSAWFVKMESGGHLTSHIHEEGWISGAVYLAIPKDNGTDGQEGAIELSSDGDGYPRLHDEFEKKVILPKVGDVIFFPSSVFHRTIPFNSNEERICIAFDVKPKLR